MFRFAVLSFGLHAALATWLIVADAPAGDLDPSGGLLGDTLDLDLLEGEPATAAGGDGSEPPQEAAARPAEPSPPTPRGPAPRVAEPSRASAASTPGASSSIAGDGTAAHDTGLFGAVGERNATDLATAFVRGFPQVASVDPAWATVPFGPLGRVVVELELSEEGRIVGHHVTSGSAPLARGIDRTVALIRGRKFTSRGARTKLVMHGAVTRDTVHDGLHGDVFAVGASFTSGSGNAFFALASGRRVDLDVSLGR